MIKHNNISQNAKTNTKKPTTNHKTQQQMIIHKSQNKYKNTRNKTLLIKVTKEKTWRNQISHNDKNHNHVNFHWKKWVLAVGKDCCRLDEHTVCLSHWKKTHYSHLFGSRAREPSESEWWTGVKNFRWSCEWIFKQSGAALLNSAPVLLISCLDLPDCVWLACMSVRSTWCFVFLNYNKI